MPYFHETQSSFVCKSVMNLKQIFSSRYFGDSFIQQEVVHAEWATEKTVLLCTYPFLFGLFIELCSKSNIELTLYLTLV